jgi:hypothetical protein
MPVRYAFLVILIAIGAALAFVALVALFALRDGLIKPK